MDKWIKIGIAGSTIWVFVIYLCSGEGLHLLSRLMGGMGYWLFDSKPVSGILLLLSGCGVAWLISYLFYKDKT